MASVGDEQDGQHEPENGVGDAEVERRRAQAVTLRDIAGEERGQADGQIAGEFVQADGEAARLRADEVDLHDHRHRPGEPLVDAEQRVGGDDPSPARPPADHERDRQPDQPADDQHRLAAVDVGEMPETRLASALTTPKLTMNDTTIVVEAIVKSSEPIRGTRPFQPDHAADEGVDEDQERRTGASSREDLNRRCTRKDQLLRRSANGTS